MEWPPIVRLLVFAYAEHNMTDVRARRTNGDIDATRIAQHRINELSDYVIPVGTKGVPHALAGSTLRQFVQSGLNVLGGELPMPVAVIKESALDANISAMQRFCDLHDVLLSPHGKTTLSPQLFARQIDAGAWAITAATPSHLRMYRSFGVDRIFYANQLVEPGSLRWLAAELNDNPGFEFYCLVDSVAAVTILHDSVTAAGLSRPINVLIEIGYLGGRCGLRDRADAAGVAAAVDASNMLHLRGVECFEGLLPGTRDDLSAVDGFLQLVAEVTRDLTHRSSLAQAESVLISAGGSAYFDRVVQTFRYDNTFEVPPRIILRSGCYVTQDGGFYAQMSPLAGRASEAPALSNALEVWAAILSRPEPGLVVTSMGRRDCSHDMGLPTPHWVAIEGYAPQQITGATVLSMSDQHAHIGVPESFKGSVGDLVGCTVSHPCTTFDKWKILPLIDDDYHIVDAIVTAF